MHEEDDEEISSEMILAFKTPMSLAEHGDYKEGVGRRLNGLSVSDGGPKNSYEFKKIIESAISDHGGTGYPARQWNNRPLPAIVTGYYRRVARPYDDGFVSIIPLQGCEFANFKHGRVFHHELVIMTENECMSVRHRRNSEGT